MRYTLPLHVMKAAKAVLKAIEDASPEMWVWTSLTHYQLNHAQTQEEFKFLLNDIRDTAKTMVESKY